MKKIIVLILLSVFAVSLVSCVTAPGSDDSKINIVTTIFPQYDWVRQIAGSSENIEITLLQDNGVDLHSYQPKASDIIKISSCDMFIFVGGESDGWVDDVLKTAKNDKMIKIDLLEILGDDAKEEEIKEGMEHEHEEEGNEDHDDPDHEHEAETDEHVWLSLKNAVRFCNAIKEGMVRIDPQNADKYESNCSSYVKKLEELDEKYAEAASSAKTKTLLFGDRFPFRYMTEDYGLDYFAAFAGCSAESEASFETVKFLAEKIDDLGLRSIIKLEGSDGRIAETIKTSTSSKDQEILTLNSLQSTTSVQIRDGATYLGEMEKNLEVIKKALG